MHFLFPSLNTSEKDAESLRKVGREIKLSTPSGMGSSASYQLGYQKVGKKEIRNKLKVRPSRFQAASGPNSGEFSITEWDSNKIVLNITTAGKIDFWIYR